LAAALLLLGAGCSSAPAPSVPWPFVHPESAGDPQLLETLAAVPPEWREPTALEIAVKMPLLVPHTAILFAREAPGALASVVLFPIELGACLLEMFGIIDRTPPRRPDPAERLR